MQKAKSPAGSRKHEIVKARKNADCCLVVSRPRTDLTALTANKTGTGSELRIACPAFVPSSNGPLRISPHRLMATGAIRFQFIPRCQRSIVVVKFCYRNTMRAVEVIPRISSQAKFVRTGSSTHRFVLPRFKEKLGFGAMNEARSVIRFGFY